MSSAQETNLRFFAYLILTLQFFLTVERQIFDFLGYMWLPILANFLNLVFIIFGTFGVWQFKPGYIISYIVWSVIWLGWNLFNICYYMEVGGLKRTEDWLSLGTRSFR